MLAKLEAFFRTVQRNKMGSVVGLCILVVLAHGYIQYKDKEVLLERDKESRLNEMRCQREKDSIQRAFQAYLIQQIKDVQAMREALDTSANYIKQQSSFN